MIVHCKYLPMHALGPNLNGLYCKCMSFISLPPTGRLPTKQNNKSQRTQRQRYDPPKRFHCSPRGFLCTDLYYPSWTLYNNNARGVHRQASVAPLYNSKFKLYHISKLLLL